MACVKGIIALYDGQRALYPPGLTLALGAMGQLARVAGADWRIVAAIHLGMYVYLWGLCFSIWQPRRI